jgi:hypothetical protein
MYRKNLKEMDANGKNGIKTLDKLSQIPVVSSAISNAGSYYVKVKDSNILWRTSFNLAELSLRTVAYAASPITTFCKKPRKLYVSRSSKEALYKKQLEKKLTFKLKTLTASYAIRLTY